VKNGKSISLLKDPFSMAFPFLQATNGKIFSQIAFLIDYS